MASIPTRRRVRRTIERRSETLAESAGRTLARAQEEVRDQVDPLLSVLRTEHSAVGAMAVPLLDDATAQVAEVQAQVTNAFNSFENVRLNSWFQDFMAPDRPWWADALLPGSLERLIDDTLRPEFYRAEYIFDLLLNTGSVSLAEHMASGWGSDRPDKYDFRGTGLFASFYGITGLLQQAYEQTGDLITALERSNLPGGRPVRRMCGVGLPQLEPAGGRYLPSERRFGERTFYEYADLGRAHTSKLFGLTATADSLVVSVNTLSRASSSLNLLIKEIRQVLEDYIPVISTIISLLRKFDRYADTSEVRREMRNVRSHMRAALREVKSLQRTLRPIRRTIRAETPTIRSAIRDVEGVIGTLWSPCRYIYPATVDADATEADRLDTSTWAPGTPRTAPRLDRDRVFLPRTGTSAGRLESESDREEEVLAFGSYGSVVEEPARFMGLLPWQALAIIAGAWMLWPEKNK